MQPFPKAFSLTHKLAVLVILALLFALAVLGIYFDAFLKRNYLESTQKRMLHGYNRVSDNFRNIETELRDGIAFVNTEEKVLASVELINNYQDKNNYNAILLDEEKKTLADELLGRVKLSFNNDIVLYDQQAELIAYVTKESEYYRLYYVSYVEARAVLYCRLEHEALYRPCPAPAGVALMCDDDIGPRYKPSIRYSTRNHNLVIESHQALFEADSRRIIAHIELTKIIGAAYFDKLSQELDIHLQLSPAPAFRGQARPLFENGAERPFEIVQTDAAYIGAMQVTTHDDPLYVVASLNKQMLRQALDDNRSHFLALLLIVALIILVLMRFILQRELAVPLKALMGQIQKIENGDYSQSAAVPTGDELEQISRNVNELASTVQEREASLKESQKVLEYLSNHDALTELPNRRFFYTRLRRALDEAQRQHGQLAVMFLDLDQFKQVNDTLGHDIGDELLKQVSRRLLASVGQIEQLARIGGDEFNILQENFTTPYDIAKLAQNILAIFTTPFMCGGHEIYSSASIGVALYPQDGEDCVTLIKHADLAMYESKDKGRNSYNFFSAQLAVRLKQRTQMMQALKEAIARGNEFELLYQPKIATHTRRIHGVEALVRWNSPLYGYTCPDRFIGLAEETHLIIPIGEWVLQQACRDFVLLQQDGYPLDHISVNVSSVQLLHEDMLEMVERTLRLTGIEPCQLELEITESYIATDAQRALETLRKLRKMDIRLAIDDFGTGYSSMSYLKQLPITRLKIDKSFVDELPYNQEDMRIVRAIIELAKTFELEITAEGVENQAQLDFLETQPCDEIQGYIYSRPIALEALKSFCRCASS